MPLNNPELPSEYDESSFLPPSDESMTSSDIEKVKEWNDAQRHRDNTTEKKE